MLIKKIKIWPNRLENIDQNSKCISLSYLVIKQTHQIDYLPVYGFYSEDILEEKCTRYLKFKTNICKMPNIVLKIMTLKLTLAAQSMWLWRK